MINIVVFNSFRVAKPFFISPPITSEVIQGSSLSGLTKQKPQKKIVSEIIGF